MPNKDGHRRFGNVRKRESGRYQSRYPGPDGRMRTGTETYARKLDAERALTLTEAAIVAGEWTDPERGRVGLGDYAASWIAQRPGLRVRTVDLYSWLLAKHIAPYLGGVPSDRRSHEPDGGPWEFPWPSSRRFTSTWPSSSAVPLRRSNFGKCPAGRTRSARSAPRACTSTTFATLATPTSK